MIDGNCLIRCSNEREIRNGNKKANSSCSFIERVRRSEKESELLKEH